MKINRMILFLFGVSLCGCFDDKGNYDYRDIDLKRTRLKSSHEWISRMP